jgi:glucoamylase
MFFLQPGQSFLRFMLLGLVLVSIPVFSAVKLTSARNQTMLSASVWLQQEAKIAEAKLKQNISPQGTAPGVVIASPQTQNPNYYRHWIRDAALVMDVVLQLWAQNPTGARGAFWNQRLEDYLAFSLKNQAAGSLGEPLFEVDGRIYPEPWGRPQNDGPALRAIVFIEWAEHLIKMGKADYVKTHLYSPTLPAKSVIKADLEYVAAHWMHGSIDLWEEVRAKHFYTEMVQRKALIMGAALARKLADPGAAAWYETQARNLEKLIARHAQNQSGWIQASLDWEGGLNSKTSNLDIAVILGVLHGSIPGHNFFSVSSPMVQKTFVQLTDVFAKLYPVNQRNLPMAAALGRYPEDVYAGTDFNGGNPWVLTTLAGAEYCYRLAGEMAKKNKVQAAKWIEAGDQFVQRVQYHANPDGSLSEQIQRHTGYMWSARDLTWNYAAILTTLWARNQNSKGLNLVKKSL